MLILNSECGSVSANSYVSLQEAQDYFDGRLYSEAWTASLSGTQEQALVTATRQLDQNYTWNGYRTHDDQALDWPRSGAYDCNNQAISADIIPVDIKNATCEQALYLLQGDSTQYPSLLTQGFKKAKLDVMEVETDLTMVPRKIGASVEICSNLGFKHGSNASFLIRGM